MPCPCCSSERIDTCNVMNALDECGACGAVFGTCYLGDSGRIASFQLYAQTPEMNVRYFDLNCLGSDGITRRHGWSDRKTGKMVQIG